jgi:hypothetical protein
MPALVDSTSVVSSTAYPSGQGYGDPVNVTVTYQFQLLDPLITAFIPQITVNANASRTLTTDCNSIAEVAPTPVPTSDLGDGSGDDSGGGSDDGSGDGSGILPTATVEPTPLPIFVSLTASKKTQGSSGTMRSLTLRTRVTRGVSGSGTGVPNMTVTVRVQGNQGSYRTITLGPTDSNGYAQGGCSNQYQFAQSEELTISTDALDNPPGGVPADGITVNIDTSGSTVCQ